MGQDKVLDAFFTIRLDFYNEGISVGYTSVYIYNSLIMSQIYNYFFYLQTKKTFYYELNFKKRSVLLR